MTWFSYIEIQFFIHFKESLNLVEMQPLFACKIFIHLAVWGLSCRIFIVSRGSFVAVLGLVVVHGLWSMRASGAVAC